MRSKSWLSLLSCFAAGAVLVAAFAPLRWWWLAYPCIACLFFVCHKLSARSAFWHGLAFGYGLYGVGVSWVYVSLHVYGGMPLWMGSISVLLFAGALALLLASGCALACVVSPKDKPSRLIALCLSWLVFEWSKSWVLTGFPWLDLGYTQTESWLFGLAPVGGVYLSSFAVLVLAASAVALIVQQRKWIPLSVMASTLLVSALASGKSWSEPTVHTLEVGIVQANVPINQKWQANFRDGVVNKLQRLSAALASEAASRNEALDLIVWPETALPLYYQQTGVEFWQAVAPPDVTLLTGLADAPSYQESYNAAILSCNGEQQLYRKRHLVPFGEYLPLRFLFNWVLEYLELPMSDFSSWQGMQPLDCGPEIRVGLSICYEDAFASEMRRYSGDATVLVNISEDAWFGDSLAPHQRLQMAQMRARELSRPMVRSGNSGPSGFIDHRGSVLATTPIFESTTLRRTVQPQTGETPYKRLGDWIVWLSLAGLLVVFFQRPPSCLKSQVVGCPGG